MFSFRSKECGSVLLRRGGWWGRVGLEVGIMDMTVCTRVPGRYCGGIGD